MRDPRRALVIVGFVFAAMEFVDAFFIEQPAAGVIFAAIVALLAWWLARSASRWPAVLLGLLGLLELLAVLFVYPTSEPDPPSWLHLAPFAVVSALVLALSVMTLAGRRAPAAG